MGEKFKEVVDDRLPVREGKDKRYTSYGRKNVFNARQGANGGWWLPILEKAYAKMNTNYANLNGGMPQQALVELTGMPSTIHSLKGMSDDDLFDIVFDGDQRGYAMTAACHFKHASLITGHAYTMLGAIRLNNGVKLLHMRNPWGNEHYKGPYHDGDSVWTTQLQMEAKMTKKNDGAFFIPVADFKKAFSMFSVLHYGQWHKDTTMQTGSGSKLGWKVKSDTDQEFFLEVHVQNYRQLAPGCPRPS